MRENERQSEGGVLIFDCEQSVRRLWDYLDDELDALELAAIDAHLATCDRCPPHFAFERRFLDAVRAARDSAVTTDGIRAGALQARVVHMLEAAGEMSSRRSTP